MTPLRRALLRVGLSAAAALLVGSAVLSAVSGLDQAQRQLRDLSAPHLLAAWAIWSLTAIPQGFRWHALLCPLPPTAAAPDPPGPWQLARVLTSSNLLNLALPGPVGELGAAWYLQRRHGVPLPLALATTLLGRLLALLLFAATSLALWPLLTVPPDTARWLRPALLLVALPAAAVASLAHPAAPPALGRALSRAAALAERPALQPLRALLPAARRWLAALQAPGQIPLRRWLRAAAWSAANTSLLGLAGWLCFQAAHTPATPAGALFLQCFTALVSVLAVVLPAGLGAVDAAFVAAFPAALPADALAPTALSPDQALASAVLVALTVRLVQIGTLLCGLPFLPRLLAEIPDTPPDTPPPEPPRA